MGNESINGAGTNPYQNVDWSKLDYGHVDYSKFDYSKVDYSKIDWSKINYGQPAQPQAPVAAPPAPPPAPQAPAPIAATPAPQSPVPAMPAAVTQQAPAALLALAPADGRPENTINALDHGVRNDGSTDNTQALQNACEAAKAANLSLWLPEGVYNHSGVVTFNAGHVVGSGDNTVLQATNTHEAAIVLTGNSPSLSNLQSRVSSSVRSSQPRDCAFLVFQAQGAVLSHLSVQGASANGIRLDNSANCKVTDCFVNGSNADGIVLVNGCTGNVVERCHVENASDDSFSSNSYPGEKQSSGNSFLYCYAGPNYKQGRGFALMGSLHEIVHRCVSVGSLWHGIIAGTDPNSTTQDGSGFDIADNLVMRNASGLPVMITTDGGINANGDARLATVTGTQTSGEISTTLGWTPRTNIASPATFSGYAGGGTGANNTPGNRG